LAHSVAQAGWKRPSGPRRRVQGGRGRFL